jgi:hypothetical protein
VWQRASRKFSIRSRAIAIATAARATAACWICEREDFYAYEQSRKGKTGAQIRDGIERGEWQGVDMTKYQSAMPEPAK